MKMAKKVLSVVLALAMVMGILSVMASALAPESAVDLYIKTDATTYAPGDVVTITVSQQVIEAVGEMYAGGQFAIGYNSAVLEPVTADTSDPADFNFTTLVDAGYDASISDIFADYPVTSINADNVANYGWNKVVMCVIGDDGSASVDCSAGITDMFTFQMKIPASAADGNYTIGYDIDAYMNYEAFSNDLNGGVYGYGNDNGYDGVENHYSLGTCSFKVSSGPSYGVEFAKDQIRFDTTPTGEYAGTFDYRTLAKITGFENQADLEANVVEAGFLFSKTETVDIDTAKAQLAGGTATYSRVNNAYISTTQIAGEFVMACLVKDIPDADKGTALSTLGYIILNDNTVITFPAVNTSTFTGLYNQYYSQAFPA